MSKVQSFEPIINAESRLLILGSTSGKKSPEKGQYYADPRNRFWQIIAEKIDEWRVIRTFLEDETT